MCVYFKIRTSNFSSRSLSIIIIIIIVHFIITCHSESMLQIYFVRHAESERNADPEDRIGGQNNWIELTLKGKEEAQSLVSD